ncbi:T9SS type A sorting domain-containing protein [candidate division WOR-3 bacterium]|nr:T9SS type A sorting domain-containing protein [candidate division WOR-3 bacterium]
MSRTMVIFAVLTLLALPGLGVSTAAADSLDITPYEIAAPERVQQEPFRPRAWFAERGGIEVQEPSLICLIVDLDTQDSVYIDTVPLWKVEPYDTIRGTFDETNPAPDVYEITFWAENDWPVNISYPPLVDTFYYQVDITEAPVSGEFSLDAVSLDPATASVIIAFSLGRSTELTLSIYDLTGKIVTRLASGTWNQGRHSVRWYTAGAAPGVYFVRLSTPGFSRSRKVVLLN